MSSMRRAKALPRMTKGLFNSRFARLYNERMERLNYAKGHLHDDDENARQLSAEILGEMGEIQDPSIEDELSSLLIKDSSVKVKCSIIHALSSYIDVDDPDDKGIAAIKKALMSDSSLQVKKTAEEVLEILLEPEEAGSSIGAKQNIVDRVYKLKDDACRSFDDFSLALRQLFENQPVIVGASQQFDNSVARMEEHSFDLTMEKGVKWGFKCGFFYVGKLGFIRVEGSLAHDIDTVEIALPDSEGKIPEVGIRLTEKYPGASPNVRFFEIAESCLQKITRGSFTVIVRKGSATYNIQISRKD